jgi:cytochrome c-type biogenesis protein CcmH
VRRALVLLATLAALLALAAPALADTLQPQHKTSVTDVEDEVMCVSCGVPLAIADSPQASAERREIARLVAQGKTKAQVKDALVATYGDRVLAMPKDDGFGLAAYLVPIAIVLAALIAGIVVVPRWRNRTRTAAAGDASHADAGPRLSEDDAARLDADLANYKL